MMSLQQWNIIDCESIRYYNPDTFHWSVRYSYYDPHNLVYNIKLTGQSWFVNFSISRVSYNQAVGCNILDFKTQFSYLNHTNSLNDIFRDFILFGWNDRSTLLRAVMMGGKYMTALGCESIIQANGGGQAPYGMLGIHNTRSANIDSIVREGLSLRFSRSGYGIWLRPPSFGVISQTRFTGEVSLVVDLSGLKIQSYMPNYEVVVGEDISFNRIVRVCDIDRKFDV